MNAICHCGRWVAAYTDPASRDLGPAPRALCEDCLSLRCDAFPGACEEWRAKWRHREQRRLNPYEREGDTE